jgi:hypothetical protein
MADFNAALGLLPQHTDYVGNFLTGMQQGKAISDFKNEQQMGQQVASGDLAGAQQSAIAHNDFPYLNNLNTLITQRVGIAQAHANVIGNVAYTLRTITDPQQRVAEFQAAVPQLRQLGISDQELSHVDLSDQGLDAYIGLAQTMKDRIAHQEKMAEVYKPQDVAGGHTLMAPNLDPNGNPTGTATSLGYAPLPLEHVERDVGNQQGQQALTFNPNPGGGYAAPGAVPGSGGAAAPGPTGATAPAQGGFGPAIDFTLHHEGGYAPHDANGAPVNFGINQSANPDVDVKNLTRDGARQVYFDRYWTPSGAANLPPAMQLPYFDTYVINEVRAKQFLQQSGGDPQKFMQLREAWQNRLVQARPQQYGRYAHAWATRNADLNAQLQGGSPPAAGDQTAQAGEQPNASGYVSSVGGGSPSGDKTSTAGAPQGYAWVDPSNKSLGVRPIKGDISTDTSTMDPGDRKAAAAQYNLTGQLPSIASMGGAAIKQAYLDEAARQRRAAGIGDHDLPNIQKYYGQHKAAADNLTGVLALQSAGLGNLERDAAAYAAVSRELDHVMTGNPIVDGLHLDYLRHMGDERVRRLDAAHTALVNAYAKINSSLTGGGNAAPTDAKGAQAVETVPEEQFHKGRDRLIDQLKIEGQNKIAATQEALDFHNGVMGSYLIPVAAKNALRQHPEKAAEFDAHFGKGTAHAVLTGAR